MWTIGVTIVLGIGIGALVCAVTRAHWSSMNPVQSTDLRRPGHEPRRTVVRAVLGRHPRRPGDQRGVQHRDDSRDVLLPRPSGRGSSAPRSSSSACSPFIVAEVTSFVAFFLGSVPSVVAGHARDALESRGLSRRLRRRSLRLRPRSDGHGFGDDHSSHRRRDQCLRRNPPDSPDHRPGAAHSLSHRRSRVHARSRSRVEMRHHERRTSTSARSHRGSACSILCIYAVVLLLLIGNSLLQRRDA